jgi:hypothetical protein
VDEGLSQSALRTALVLASLAALVILAGLFSDVVRYVCVGIIVLAALATVSERGRRGGGWWTLLGAGAALSAIGAGVAELQDSVGGLIAVVGGVLVVVGSVIGFPMDELEYDE